MIKLCVCVKQVPDSDHVKIDPQKGTLRRGETNSVMNSADTRALQMAVQIAEDLKESGEETEITAITMGPPNATLVLREAMAKGADKAVLLCDPSFAGADTFSTTLILAEAIKKLGDFSVVFTGRRSSDGETGHVGAQLAERLNRSFLSGVKYIWNEQKRKELHEKTDKPFMVVERYIDGVEETLLTTIPFVLSTEEIERVHQSLPIGKICDACKEPIITMDKDTLGLCTAETGLTGSKTKVTKIYLPEQKSKGKVMSGNIEAMAERLAEVIGTQIK